MKPVRLIPLIIIAAVLGTALAFLAFERWYVIETERVPVRFTVTNGTAIGFDVGREALSFGKVQTGGAASRKASMVSAVPTVAHLKSNVEWLQFQERFELAPNVPQEVAFTLEVPADAKPGNYTGYVVITYTRP